MKAAVVGGGLAGLTAALVLVDSGHDVTVYEARPTLGGAVQTLPEREGDPSPPPDAPSHVRGTNGAKIAVRFRLPSITMPSGFSEPPADPLQPTNR